MLKKNTLLYGLEYARRILFIYFLKRQSKKTLAGKAKNLWYSSRYIGGEQRQILQIYHTYYVVNANYSAQVWTYPDNLIGLWKIPLSTIRRYFCFNITRLYRYK